MTEVPNKNFWEKEYEKMWELFNKLQNEVKGLKVPLSVAIKLEEECYILGGFFMGKMFPLEEKVQIESEARKLGYAWGNGIEHWFKKRVEEEKKSLYKRSKKFPSTKKEGEIGCVKRFYGNNKRPLKDSQIKIPQEDSPVDVTIVEDGKEVHYQVTLFMREEKAFMKLREVSYWVDKENIKEDIIKAVKDKEPKSRGDIILLLCSFFSEEEYVEKAVTGLSIASSFREIYIVMPNRNFPVEIRRQPL